MIGILIVAHGTLSESLAAAVTHVLGGRPPQFATLPVASTDDPSVLLPKAQELVRTLDTGAQHRAILPPSCLLRAESRRLPVSICPCSSARRLTATGIWTR